LRNVLLLISALAASAAPPTQALQRRAAAGESQWTYDRCDSMNGPNGWMANFCGGETEAAVPSQQSPINLCAATPLASPPKLAFSGWDGVKAMTVNSDNQLYLDVSGHECMLDAGILPRLVGRSAAESIQWKLVQAQMHWGRNRQEGSEHFIEGKQHAAELHMVHINAKHANLTAALESGETDALLVLGQLYKVGQGNDGYESDSLNTLVSAAQGYRIVKGYPTPTNRRTSHVRDIAITDVNITLADLVNTQDGYYTYAGSLTMPTCNAAVTWIVMSKVETISVLTFNKLLLLGHVGQDDAGAAVSKFGNFRPLQSRGARTVYGSFGIASCTTSACSCSDVNGTGLPVEPFFDCSGSGSSKIVGGSVIWLLLPLSMLLLQTAA